MQTVSLVKSAYYLPENVIENSFFIAAEGQDINPMFRGVKQRRHVSENESAVYMITQSIQKLIDELNLDPGNDIDMLLTNVTLPCGLFMGVGAIVAKKIGAKPDFVFDFHHSGCVSFVTMLDLAKTFIESKKAKTAIICNVQNTAGQIFNQKNTRKKPHACVPGDGCGVAYIKAGEENPIVSIVQKCHTENAEGMHLSTEDGRRYWEPGSGETYLDFDEAKIAKTVASGNKIVPQAIHAACQKAGLDYRKIDLLITNQASRLFLRNWREAVELPKEKHLDTFSELGNLFGAAIPINLTRAIEQKKLKPGDNLVLAGFSHAGDFSAAAVIQWKTP